MQQHLSFVASISISVPSKQRRELHNENSLNQNAMSLIQHHKCRTLNVTYIGLAQFFLCVVHFTTLTASRPYSVNGRMIDELEIW
jgi:hypothetical protein